MSKSPYAEPQSHQYWPQPSGYYAQPNPAAHAYPMPTASPRSPGVAAILSILVPGLGHLYSGNPFSAIFWFLAAAVAGALVYILIGFVLLPVVWIGSVIHAYVSTTNYNIRHHVVR